MDLRARFKTNGPQLDVGEKEKTIPAAVKLELSSAAPQPIGKKSLVGRDSSSKGVFSRHSV